MNTDLKQDSLPSSISLKIESLFLDIRQRFNLSKDMQSEEAIIDELTKGSEISGTNLWLLVCAIFIASIGLNMNSTAVIIGAMLVSPLMGPILGTALGVATFRFSLIRNAAKSLGFAVITSVVTSTTYFLISPLSQAQSELLARTNPSIWDVIIALVGGIAGMVGLSRKQPGNVIPGVAIATALMPPLCTAGYGLATWQLEYFLGAFYLFFINSVFICVGGILVIRLLKLHPEHIPNPATASLLRKATIGVALLAMVPSFFLTYRIIKETLFHGSAQKFIASEITPLGLPVISREIRYHSEKPSIQITYLGTKLSEEKTREIQERLKFYRIEKTELLLKSASTEDQASVYAIKSGLIEELLQKTQSANEAKDLRIRELEQRLKDLDHSVLLTELSAELNAQIEGLVDFSLSRTSIIDSNGSPNEIKGNAIVGLIRTSKPTKSADQERIQRWLLSRMKADQAFIQFKVSKKQDAP